MNTLVIMNTLPYGNTNATDGLDMLLALAVFEQSPGVLFTGDGVLQLLIAPELETPFKHIGKMFTALSLYDIETLYVDAASLLQHNLDISDLAHHAECLDTQQVADLLHAYSHVMVF